MVVGGLQGHSKGVGGKTPLRPDSGHLLVHSWAQVVKVYSEDGACRSVEVAAGATVRHVCEMLVQRTQALSDENWGLVECHPYLALGEQGHREPWEVAQVETGSPTPTPALCPNPRAGPGGP